MISLRFTGGQMPRDDLEGALFRFVGDEVQDDQGNLVATRLEDSWKAAGEEFTAIGIVSPALLVFEQSGESHGPYQSLWLVNGCIRTGENQQDLIARFDHPTKQWQSATTSNVSKSVLIRTP